MFSKKFIRFCLALVGIVIAALLILGIFQPHDITVSRSATINAPKEAVFAQMVQFKNWPNWSPWSRLDTSMKSEFTGTDGTPGSTYHWIGDDHKTGEALIKNTAVNGTEMQFTFTLVKPGNMEANGSLKAEDAPGGCKATMTFTNHYSYPWNALVFLTNLEKTIGPDLEKAVNNIKAVAEKK
jgi:uncharacterized membrane protein